MNKLKNLLNQNNLRITPARIDVLKYLNKVEFPQSSQEIGKALGEKYDLATIYRTLESFVKNGVVFSERQEKEKKYYFDKERHHHVVCTSCGYTECVPCNHSFKIKNFVDLRHDLVVEGRCKNCK